MKRALRITALAIGLLALHSFAAALLPTAPRPDFILVFALIMGLRARGTGGLIASFLLGFAVDVVSGSPIGLYALLRGTACVATRLFDRALYVRSSLPWAIYMGAYTLLDGILLGVLLRTLAPEAEAFWGGLLGGLVLSALMNAVVASPLLSLVKGWDGDGQRDGGWSALASRART